MWFSPAPGRRTPFYSTISDPFHECFHRLKTDLTNRLFQCHIDNTRHPHTGLSWGSALHPLHSCVLSSVTSRDLTWPHGFEYHVYDSKFVSPTPRSPLSSTVRSAPAGVPPPSGRRTGISDLCEDSGMDPIPGSPPAVARAELC